MLTIQDVYPVFGEGTKKILRKVQKINRPSAANVSSPHFLLCLIILPSFFLCLFILPHFFLHLREVAMKLWTTCGREVPSTSFFFIPSFPSLLLFKKCSPSLTNGQIGWTPLLAYCQFILGYNFIFGLLCEDGWSGFTKLVIHNCKAVPLIHKMCDPDHPLSEVRSSTSWRDCSRWSSSWSLIIQHPEAISLLLRFMFAPPTLQWQNMCCPTSRAPNQVLSPLQECAAHII